MNEVRKQIQERYRQKRNEYQKRYYAEHKEEYRAYSHEHYLKKKEKLERERQERKERMRNQIIKAWKKCIDEANGCCGDDTTCPYCREDENIPKCFQQLRIDILNVTYGAMQKKKIDNLVKEMTEGK